MAKIGNTRRHGLTDDRGQNRGKPEYFDRDEAAGRIDDGGAHANNSEPNEPADLHNQIGELRHRSDLSARSSECFQIHASRRQSSDSTAARAVVQSTDVSSARNE